MTNTNNDLLSFASVDTFDRAVQTVVSDLKFISRFKKDKKVDIGNMCMYEIGIPTSIHRTFVRRGESRETVFDFVTKTLTEAFKLANIYLSSDTCKGRCSIIIKAIVESRVGIEQLKECYKDDEYFASRLETQLQTLDINIEDFHNKIHNTH